MITRFRCQRVWPVFSLIVAALAILVLGIARPATAISDNRGIHSGARDRAADDAVILFMHETTSLRSNGDGEERLEFLITNNSYSPAQAASFYFDIGSTNYWNVSAWDDQGKLYHEVTVDGQYIEAIVYFRDEVKIGEQYRYYFAITLPDVAEKRQDTWKFGWGTYFDVVNFWRTVNLPTGATVTYVNPNPTEKTAEYIRWKRNGISWVTGLSVYVDYTLKPLTDLELAQKFSPYFRMHAEEIYVPMKINLALSHAQCYLTSSAAPQSCSLDLLGNDWRGQDKSYIDFNGWPGGGLNGENSSHRYYRENVRQEANKEPVVYARVVPANNQTVIQYWLFYYYNSWGIQGGAPGYAGLHEGDWEMVQVILGEDKQPLYAAYAQHLGGSKKEWDDLSPGLNIENNHPIVYPGLGSHASYFGPYKYYLVDLDKTAMINQPLLKPQVVLLQPSTIDQWVRYKGKWGQEGYIPLFQGGPSSPANQGLKWSNPLSWAQTNIKWDEYASHHFGKVQAHVDAPCHVGVKIGLLNPKYFGWVHNEYKEEIDGGEYIDNQHTETRSLILHNTYKMPLPTYYESNITCSLIKSMRQLTERPQLSIEFYDESSDEVVVAHFRLSADWQPESIGSVVLGDASALQLQVDLDDDGVIDEIVTPESVNFVPIDGIGKNPVYVPIVRR